MNTSIVIYYDYSLLYVFKCILYLDSLLSFKIKYIDIFLSFVKSLLTTKYDSLFYCVSITLYF